MPRCIEGTERAPGFERATRAELLAAGVSEAEARRVAELAAAELASGRPWRARELVDEARKRPD